MLSDYERLLDIVSEHGQLHIEEDENGFVGVYTLNAPEGSKPLLVLRPTPPADPKPDAVAEARSVTRARLAMAAEEAILAGFCEGPQFAHLRQRHHEHLAAEQVERTGPCCTKPDAAAQARESDDLLRELWDEIPIDARRSIAAGLEGRWRVRIHTILATEQAEREGGGE